MANTYKLQAFINVTSCGCDINYLCEYASHGEDTCAYFQPDEEYNGTVYCKWCMGSACRCSNPQAHEHALEMMRELLTTGGDNGQAD